MIILIPIGGIGSRFKKNGYNNPKALINVLGKPIIFWLLDNLILLEILLAVVKTWLSIVLPPSACRTFAF